MGLHALILACISHTAFTRVVFRLPFPFSIAPLFLSLTFCFTQISFFASLLPRLLRQAGRPTSLSSASVCSPADPGFLLAPSFGPGTSRAVCCTGAIHPVYNKHCKLFPFAILYSYLLPLSSQHRIKLQFGFLHLGVHFSSEHCMLTSGVFKW